MRQCGFANVSSSHVSARRSSIVSRPRARPHLAGGGRVCHSGIASRQTALRGRTKLPDRRYRVLRDYPIPRDNCHLADLRLSDDETIKRVAVDFRQRLDLFKHDGLNRKHLDVSVKAQGFQFWNRHAKLHLADALLDGDFPKGGNTDRNVFCLIY